MVGLKCTIDSTSSVSATLDTLHADKSNYLTGSYFPELIWYSQVFHAPPYNWITVFGVGILPRLGLELWTISQQASTPTIRPHNAHRNVETKGKFKVNVF